MKFEAQNTSESKMYEIFQELGITDFTVQEHVAVFTMEEVEKYGLMGDGLNLKNILIKEKKTGRYFLVILDDSRRIDMKHFKGITGWKQTSFASSDELFELTGMISGAVTPLALFNDIDKRITVVLGKEIVDAPDEETMGFHPCRNTATIFIKKHDFMKFLEYTGNEVVLEESYPPIDGE